jgi:hypothetical protein
MITEAERDRIFAAVWATPEGAALLTLLRSEGQTEIKLSDIALSLLRARRRWATGAQA